MDCYCTDPGCPVHKGRSACYHKGEITVYRDDMQDETGTPMCEDCAADALESGVFSTRDADQDERDEVVPGWTVEEILAREG